MNTETKHTPTGSDRFWSKVDKTSGCWNWTACLHHGYGWFSTKNKPEGAHRVAYRMFKGAIPSGLVIDHVCRNRRCVNPDHMRLVTIAENVRAGGRAIRTHCPNGHAYDIFKKCGWRGCRTCTRKQQRKIYQSNKQAICKKRREIYAKLAEGVEP